MGSPATVEQVMERRVSATMCFAFIFPFSTEEYGFGG